MYYSSSAQVELFRIGLPTCPVQTKRRRSPNASREEKLFIHDVISYLKNKLSIVKIAREIALYSSGHGSRIIDEIKNSTRIVVPITLTCKTPKQVIDCYYNYIRK